MSPRPAEVPGVPADQVLKVRLTPPDTARLDAARGKTPRSAWVRDLIRATLADDQKSTPRPRRLSELPVPAKPVENKDDQADELYQGKGHRHRRGRLLSELPVKGRVVKTYACAEDGCNEELVSR